MVDNNDIQSQIDKLNGLIETFDKQSALYNKIKSDFQNDLNTMYSNFNNLVKQGSQEELKSKNILSRRVELFGRKLKNANEYNKLVAKEKDALSDIEKMREKARKAESDGNLDVAKTLNNIANLHEVNLGKQKIANSLLQQSTGMSSKFISAMTRPIGAVLMIANTLMKVGKFIKDTITKSFKLFLKMQVLTGNLSADLGMSLGLTTQLQDNFAELSLSAMAYGGTMEDVVKAISKYSEIVGKNRLFTTDEMGALANLGRSLNIGIEGMGEIVGKFDIINAGVGETTKLVNYSIEQATKFSLNGSKLVKEVANVFERFKGFTFKNGLKDLTDMVAKSQTLRFNLDNMKSLSDNLFSPENAIEMSAKLRVLGGNMAQIADPFKLMFQAMSDPVGLLNSLIDSVVGLATKNPNGLFSIPPNQRAVIREMAQALGQDPDNLINAALEQSKMIDKINSLNFKIMDEKDRMAIANMLQFDSNSKSYFTNIDNVMVKASNLTRDNINALLEQAKINESAARGRKNFVDRFREYGQRFQMALSNLFLPLYEIFDRGGKLETEISTLMSELTQTVANSLKGILGGKSGLAEIIKKSVTVLSGAVERIGIFINEVRGTGSLLDQIKKIVIATMKELIPVFKLAISEVGKTLSTGGPLAKMLFGGFAKMGQDEDVLRLKNQMADDFIYSNKHGLTKFRKDDLVVGGTSITNNTNQSNTSTPQPTNIQLNISGTLKVESSDNSYSFSKDELRDIGLTQLTKLIMAEKNKIERGTLKNTPNMKVKPING